ncbi:pseudouridine synthase PUS2 KNAG_0F01920 [Huiozyma naganishii CBS 8797]|uniref:tRNA pseudouridine synthase 1 n=1 Tax=Huiozyma naganishii (strain ATCC MYA-139 / BCRC 22969 / CBS 8797 / KCTC 17520 / NBRC 10181 / NCYC 3082 / Yp74L-3) TaxID=1071383 RepID=J7R7L3_HUIN7|nr:hypothetical protein KNAG_0F01920 [Kazachstania naganishii CBS 8797]CCK70860.1 hypothetical protein KNAG_0F01920 [Kazachstania naganishii CBS 8797]
MSTNCLKRIPKRRVAVLFGYSGSQLYGMQYIADASRFPTVESRLFDAIRGTGAIMAHNSDDIYKNGWNRACRTDKGVHALGNVVSLKLNLTADLVPRLNAQLPEGIRVWAIQSVNKQFSGKTACGGRWYEYIFPSFILMGHSKFHRIRLNQSQKFDEDTNYEAYAKSLQVPLSQYRVDQDTVSSLRQYMQEYLGTHNFHNFTTKKQFTDRDVKRYISDVVVSQPFQRAAHPDEPELMSIRIRGQSFMIHQIRKMIAMAVIFHHYGIPPEQLNDILGETKQYIPKVPSSGLFLDFPLFDSYNRKLVECGHSPIDFQDYSSEMFQLKQALLLPEIVRAVQTRHEYAKFLDHVESTEWLDQFRNRYTGGTCPSFG